MIASSPKVRNASIRFDKRSENSAKKGPEDLTVEELMLRIIQKVNFSSQSPQETGEVTEAILEMDLDGMHYTLIRSSPKHTYYLSPREQEIVRLVQLHTIKGTKSCSQFEWGIGHDFSYRF
jgi:hypothetical protein